MLSEKTVLYFSKIGLPHFYEGKVITLIELVENELIDKACKLFCESCENHGHSVFSCKNGYANTCYKLDWFKNNFKNNRT